MESQSQLVLENSVLFCPFLGRFKGGSFLGRQKNHGPQSFSQQLIFERYPTWLEAFPKGNSSSNLSVSGPMLVSGRLDTLSHYLFGFIQLHGIFPPRCAAPLCGKNLIARILHEILLAAREVHRHGFVHRDSWLKQKPQMPPKPYLTTFSQGGEGIGINDLSGAVVMHSLF